MKKNILFACIILFSMSCTFSQISLTIDSLSISEVSLKINNSCKGKFIEGLDGPQGIFYISIKNETDSFVTLNINQLNFGYMYYYNGNFYEATLLTFQKLPVQYLLLPGEKYTLTFSPSILINDKIRKINNFDYACEMLKILPSIRAYCICYELDKKIITSKKYQKIIIDTTAEEPNCYKSNISSKKFLNKLKQRNK